MTLQATPPRPAAPRPSRDSNRHLYRADVAHPPADHSGSPRPYATVPTDDLLRWREEFPILAQSVYLVSHSLGAMPRGVRDRLAEFADVWASRGVRAWHEGWWEMPRTVGDL